MTPDTRSLGPPSLHDNTVGAQEKMQCTELEASIQAMRWEAETWLQGGEKDNTGSQSGRQTRTGCLKNSYVPPLPHTWSPCSQLPSIYGWAAGPKPVSVTWATAGKAGSQNYQAHHASGLTKTE